LVLRFWAILAKQQRKNTNSQNIYHPIKIHSIAPDITLSSIQESNKILFVDLIVVLISKSVLSDIDISAANRFGKSYTPVLMQGKAMDCILFASATLHPSNKRNDSSNCGPAAPSNPAIA
jgi:hypothetical protein